MKTKKIAFYGKGGIGKSTISSNVSAELSNEGYKVLHIGCDPKSDSTLNLVGEKIPTILEVLNTKENIALEDIMHKGYAGVYCIEIGGPVAGVGCAGMAINTGIDLLNELEILDMEWDYIIYDVLGDVVCGGFATPMKKKYVDTVYIVTTEEYMSIYAANNILKSVEYYSNQDNPILGGIIVNKYQESEYNEIIYKFSESTNSKVIYQVPLDLDIKRAELKTTVVSEISSKNIFKNLADYISNQEISTFPHALSDLKMKDLKEDILKKIEE